MEALKNFGNQSLPSVIKDPFSTSSVTRIYVSIAKSWFDNSYKASGSIKFKNGDTEAEQNFEGKTFDDVVIKIKSCIDNL
jgi:hypothetical protein